MVPSRSSSVALYALLLVFAGASVSAQSDLARAKQTKADILSAAVAWEAFASDTNTYLPGNVAAGLTSRGNRPGEDLRWSNYIELSYEALRKALVPTYIRELPRLDGWGNPLQFAVHIEDSQGLDYVIRSLGSDGAEDNEGRYRPSATQSFTSDMVFNAGEFKVYPAALVQRQTPPLDELRKLQPAEQVVALLEGSGLSYSKIQDNLWSTEFSGKNATNIQVLVLLVEDVAVITSKLSAKNRLNLTRETLAALLQFNNDYDGVKVTVDEEHVWIRYDARLRVVDGPEWDYILNQVASGVDELVKILQPALKRVGA